MWHEARKQERKIRGIMVDYKRRAERRKDFYEKIKADPTQFLQIHGRSLKVHLDPSVAAAGDSPANMMPWQGHADILIDRFDVRAHLDYIPENNHLQDRCVYKEITREERLANYERYRIIVQNDFLGVGEEKFLHQLYVDEQYGPVNRVVEVDKKKKVEKAAIPYTYEESSLPPVEDDEDGDIVETEEENGDVDEEEDGMDSKLDEEEDDSDIDFDLCVDVSKVDPQQAHEMNLCGAVYGMVGNDFFSFLSSDIQEKESQRQAREQEEEKAMFSGRKSRRERRAFREKRLQGRKISPPSYAARSSPTYYPYRKSISKSRSRSHSPIACGRITYITSFGGEEEDDPNKDRRNKQSISAASKLGKDVRSKASRFEGVSRSGAPTSTSHSRHKSSSYRSPSPIINHQFSETQRRKRMASHSPKDGGTSVSRSRSRRYLSPNYKLGSRRDSRSSDSSTSRHSNSPHRSRCKEKKANKKKSRSRSPYRNNSYSSKCSNRRRSSSSSTSNKMEPSSVKAKEGDKNESLNIQQHQPPVKKYYSKIRRSSSSSVEENSDSNCSMVSSTMNNGLPNTSTHKITKTIGNSGAEIKLQLTTPQEKLKKKMQALLNRQYKADKKAERMRNVKLEQERQDREDELREMAIKLRRRERERRHRMQDENEDGDDDGNESEDKSVTSASNTVSSCSSQSPTKTQQERSTPEQQNVEGVEDMEDVIEDVAANSE